MQHYKVPKRCSAIRNSNGGQFWPAFERMSSFYHYGFSSYWVNHSQADSLRAPVLMSLLLVWCSHICFPKDRKLHRRSSLCISKKLVAAEQGSVLGIGRHLCTNRTMGTESGLHGCRGKSTTACILPSRTTRVSKASLQSSWEGHFCKAFSQVMLE